MSLMNQLRRDERTGAYSCTHLTGDWSLDSSSARLPGAAASTRGLPPHDAHLASDHTAVSSSHLSPHAHLHLTSQSYSDLSQRASLSAPPSPHKPLHHITEGQSHDTSIIVRSPSPATHMRHHTEWKRPAQRHMPSCSTLCKCPRHAHTLDDGPCGNAST